MIVVWYLYLVAPLPASAWRPLGGVLVLLLASWGPVVLGFGEPFAAAAMLVNVALGSFAYKTWMARTEAA